MGVNETTPAVMIPRRPAGIINKQEPRIQFNIDGKTVRTITLPAIPPLPPSISVQSETESLPLQSLYSNYNMSQSEIQDECAIYSADE